MPAGGATVVMDFVYEGKKKEDIGKGGTVTISENGKTQPLIFSADETADVGLDNQTPVAKDIGVGRQETRFTGSIKKITLDVRDVANPHL